MENAYVSGEMIHDDFLLVIDEKTIDDFFSRLLDYDCYACQDAEKARARVTQNVSCYGMTIATWQGMSNLAKTEVVDAINAKVDAINVKIAKQIKAQIKAQIKHVAISTL